jgi:hypothetical protein
MAAFNACPAQYGAQIETRPVVLFEAIVQHSRFEMKHDA